MAVPTFTSVSPAIGSAGGRNVVTIIGTNFLVPADPTESVKVEFDGVNALRVDVMSATELRVIVPHFRGEGSQAYANPIAKIPIRIYNIDDEGDPIAGETVTTNNAYRYERVAIRDPRATQQNQAYRRVMHEVIWAFQRQVIPNVAIGTSVNYGEAGSVTIQEAKVPNVMLMGPRITENMENRHRWADPFDTDNYYWVPTVDDFEFDIRACSNSKRELYGMVQGIREMFLRTPYLLIPITVGAPNDGDHRFPFVLADPPGVTVIQPNSDLVLASASFQVRRVPFRFDDPTDVIAEILSGEAHIYGETEFTGDYDTITFATSD
jgi:hypothetical protein